MSSAAMYGQMLGDNLQARILFWILLSLITGALFSYLWVSSVASWSRHLDHAYHHGVSLYEVLIHPDIDIGGHIIKPLGYGESPTSIEPGVKVTSASIFLDSQSEFGSGERLQLEIHSSDLQYPLAKIRRRTNAYAAEQLGELSRLIASFCSHPKVFARVGSKQWVKVEAPHLWNCSSAPKDYRVLAVIVLGLSGLLLFTLITDTGSQFRRFAKQLRDRARYGTRERFDETKLVELQDVAQALNRYLDQEKKRIEKRAELLSGVSHDLGTPASRLRLRTVLIEDAELRAKLEADIDQMTDMIESVLSYTHAEMNIEEPRLISLSALVQSAVDNYRDVGRPVNYIEQQSQILERGHSIFGGGGDIEIGVAGASRILAMARPILLQRAIVNLIDNALKFGRRAEVFIEADSSTATIVVQDEGRGVDDNELAQLISPFQRGENAANVEGVGLGLTIVETIANSHGGQLSFEQHAKGLQARLSIARK